MGINDRGQVIVNSFNATSTMAFRLDPLAEPSVVVIVPTLSGWGIALTCLLVILAAVTGRRQTLARHRGYHSWR